MRVRILVSLLSLMVICFGVRYAIGRERLRSPEYIHALYQQTNKEFFDGQLPDVAVRLEDLSEANAEGETYKESEELFVIVLDPKWNTSEDEALHTMRHESCHVATWGQEPDEHGPRFQECVRRLGQKGQVTTPGPLTDTQLPVAEQEAMANFFAGAIGLYKNPQSHRHVPTHAEDAAEVIVFASQLLRIVDRLKP